VIPAAVSYRRIPGPQVTSALIGASSVAQLESSLAALDFPELSAAELAAIEPHAVHGTENR
jgi:L-glyceraldehyde 3-phosphate reductase